MPSHEELEELLETQNHETPTDEMMAPTVPRSDLDGLHVTFADASSVWHFGARFCLKRGCLYTRRRSPAELY